MVATQHDRIRGEYSVVLRPDVACHWRQTMVLYGLVVFVVLTVAIGFAAVGLWPVLPFAGAELLALGAALYVSAQRGHDCEWIRVRDGKVEVSKGRRRAEFSVSFERVWTEVVLMPPQHPWYPTRLVLRSSGREVELGAFLRDEERCGLARELQLHVGTMAASGDTP